MPSIRGAREKTKECQVLAWGLDARSVARRASAITGCLRRKNTEVFSTGAVVTNPHCPHFFENVWVEATENWWALTKVSLVLSCPLSIGSPQYDLPLPHCVMSKGLGFSKVLRWGEERHPLGCLVCTPPPPNLELYQKQDGTSKSLFPQLETTAGQQLPSPLGAPYHLCHLNRISSLTGHVGHDKPKAPPVPMCETPGVPPKSTRLVPLTAERN